VSDTILHASCVSFNGRAALITGSSGSGKSALALELMAYGASLVADDRVVLRAQDGQITASAPDTIKGLIEARGFGILNADTVDHADVVVCIDLGLITCPCRFCRGCLTGHHPGVRWRLGWMCAIVTLALIR